MDAVQCILNSKNKKTQNRCFVCQEGFANKKLCRDHIDDCHKDKEKGIYFCKPPCERTYEMFIKFRSHCRYFHASKTQRCPDCQQTFKRIDKLKRHMLTHDKDRRDYLCCRCGLTFRRLDKLKDHEKNKHEEKPTKIAAASKIVVAEQFDNSIGVHKSPERPKQSTSAALMDVEAMTPGEFSTLISTNSNPFRVEYFTDTCAFVCNMCHATFKRYGMFKKHMKDNHPTVDLSKILPEILPVLKSRSVFRCPFCFDDDDTTTFTNMERLRKHVDRYHDGQPIGTNVRVKLTDVSVPLKCNYCDNEYVNAWKLREHINKKHTNDRVFQCDDEVFVHPSVAAHNTDQRERGNQSFDQIFDQQLEAIEQCHVDVSPSVTRVRPSTVEPLNISQDAFVPTSPSPTFPSNLPHETVHFSSCRTLIMGNNSKTFQLNDGAHYVLNGAPSTSNGEIFADDHFALQRPVTPVTPLPVAVLSSKLVTPQFYHGEHSYMFSAGPPTRQP